MESRFGHDFSRVRVHDDASAAAAANDIDAAAFTFGEHIAFGCGRHVPMSIEGRELLAHELAHTVQQRGAQVKGPPVQAGSVLEAQAEQAGRDVASGCAVTGSLGTSGLAVARAPNRPEYLDSYTGKMLAEAASMWRWTLAKRPNYPGRAQDVQLLNEITAEIERRGAISDLNAALAPANEDEEPREATMPTPMALPRPGTAPRPPSRAAAQRKPPRVQAPPSKFEPGGFTDKDIYGPLEELDVRLAKPRDSRPFEDRFYKARRDAPLASSLETTWEVGRNEGLFTEDDRWAFERLWEERIGKPARSEARRNANVESVRREMAWEAQGEQVLAQSQAGIFQAALLGGTPIGGVSAFGEPVATGYEGYTYFDIARQTYHAAQTGNIEDIISAGLPLAGGVALHSGAGGGESASEPAPSVTGTERAPVAPEPTPQRPAPAGTGAAGGGERRLLWGRWEDYPIVRIGDKQYAQIGDRLYSPHVVERMGPRGTAPSALNPAPTKLEKPQARSGLGTKLTTAVAYHRRTSST